MIHLFRIEDASLVHELARCADDLRAPGTLWIDLVAPTEEELIWLRAGFDIDAETPDENDDIETSARLYEKGGKLYLRANFMSGRQQDYAIVPTQLIVADNRLISLHDEDVPIIRLLRLRNRNKAVVMPDAVSLLIDLYTMDVEFSADVLEDVHAELKAISAAVLGERRGTDVEAAEFIARIGRQEELNGAIRLNLMDTRRALSYLAREQPLGKARIKAVQQVLRDIESLDSHTGFIFDKVNFLMDAIIGFINVSQNKVVKIFSVAAVAMLPPTLIASIYGMNFEYMPELAQTWGYPMSLTLMVISVIVPFWYFRRKGWLK